MEKKNNMKKIIVIEQDKSYQFDSFEELVKALLEENYYEMNEKQKNELLNKKAMFNKLNKKDTLIVENVIDNDEVDNKIIIKDEYTYILSLVSLNIITILERKDADMFFKGWDKNQFEGNYIIVNNFAKRLLSNYYNNIKA